MKNKNRKLLAFIQDLKNNGTNINEAYLEVSEYVPEHFLDEASKLIRQVYTKDTGAIQLTQNTKWILKQI
jgi:hypothetical protein